MANNTTDFLSEELKKYLGPHFDSVLLHYIKDTVANAESSGKIDNMFESAINEAISKSHSTIDVSNLFVCIYDGDKVGLFSEEIFVDTKSFPKVTIYGIYRCYGSNYTAIKQIDSFLDKPTSDPERVITNYCPSYTVKCINNVYYASNCEISEVLGSFEGIRQKIPSINTATLGMASREEMFAVIKYVQDNLLNLNNRTK